MIYFYNLIDLNLIGHPISSDNLYSSNNLPLFKIVFLHLAKTKLLYVYNIIIIIYFNIYFLIKNIT